MTYQETAALVQESLAATKTFAQDHVSHPTDSLGVLSDWNRLGLQLGLHCGSVLTQPAHGLAVFPVQSRPDWTGLGSYDVTFAPISKPTHTPATSVNSSCLETQP